jgi:hypothetical protein
MKGIQDYTIEEYNSILRETDDHNFHIYGNVAKDWYALQDGPNDITDGDEYHIKARAYQILKEHGLVWWLQEDYDID